MTSRESLIPQEVAKDKNGIPRIASTWPAEVFGVRVALGSQAGVAVCGAFERGGFSLACRRLRTLRWHPKTWHVRGVYIPGGKHFSEISSSSLVWSEDKALL